jgi:hypothetical protein
MASKIHPDVLAYVERIQAPQGWTREVIEHKCVDSDWGQWAYDGMVSVRLLGSTEGIIFRVTTVRNPVKGEDPVCFSGTTLFKVNNMWTSFDRRGIDDSFYSPFGEPLPDPLVVTKEQIIRIKRWREQDALKENVPGTPYRINPQQRSEYCRRLQQGLPIEFTPSGMGIGKRYHTKRRTPYAKPAPREMATYFGVSALWMTEFDYD